MESSAAAPWESAWVSTPPVMARLSTMVIGPSLSKLRGGTRLLTGRAVGPDLCQGRSSPHRQGQWVPEGILGPVDRSLCGAARSCISRFTGQTATQECRPYDEVALMVRGQISVPGFGHQKSSPLRLSLIH